MILLLSMLDKAENWVSNHLPYFYKNKKSLMEYYQMNLYDQSFDKKSLAILLSYCNGVYHSLSNLLNSDEAYYRKIEYLALLSLATPSMKNTYNFKINEIFYSGFLNKLITGEISLEILSSRDHIYVITHDIFYSTLFSKDIKVLKNPTIDTTKLKTIIEQALLMSIKNKDIDVLMELLCCVCILKIPILDFIIDLSLELLRDSQEKDGYFIYDEDRKYSDIEIYFSKVYHTTLVACILKKIIENNKIDLNDIIDRQNRHVNISIAHELLHKMNTRSIDLLYSNVRYQFQYHKEKLTKLSNYGEVFICLTLLELFKEHYETTEKLLFICNRLGIESCGLDNRLVKLKKAGKI